MGSRNKCPRKVIVVLRPGSLKPVPVPADEEMCFLNGNPDGIHPFEKKERMHEIVTPGPNLFPRSDAKVVARVERARVVRELGATGAELFETYVVQLSSCVENELPETQNCSLRIILSLMIGIGGSS